MKTVLDPTNRSALKFNYAAEERMAKLCAPLQPLNICFTYCRLFKDGKRLYLCSTPQWVENYLNHGFQNDLDHLEYYSPQPSLNYALWSGFKKDSVFDAIYNFGYWHGFALYERAQNYIDTFDFSPPRNNHKIKEYFLHNVTFFQNFIKEFKEEAKDLIDPIDQRKLIVPKNLPTVDLLERPASVGEKEIKNFMKQIRYKFLLPLRP